MREGILENGQKVQEVREQSYKNIRISVPCQKKERVLEMDKLLERCCGLDVHKDKIEACIIDIAVEEPNRETFDATPAGYERLSNWLNQNDCRNIAMESTGVYWIPLYEILEEKLKNKETIIVGNAYHMKNVPGRKTDVKDAEWIAGLLQHGLIEQSFVPERTVRDMREIARQKRNLINSRTTEINHLEKYLQRHGIKLSSVLSSITGTSSMLMLKELAKSGELTLDKVRQYHNGRMKNSPEKIYEAVCVKLSTAECRLLDFDIRHIEEITRDIEELSSMLAELFTAYEVHLKIATSIPGISTESAMEILAEISPKPDEAFLKKERVCKWAGLTPRNDGSADKIISRKTLHGNPYVKSLLVQCAWVAVKARNSVFNNWFWSRQGRIGRKKAIVAVARKILALLFTLLERGEFYDPNTAIGMTR